MREVEGDPHSEQQPQPKQERWVEQLEASAVTVAAIPITTWDASITFRRSRMSASAPAGRARKRGSVPGRHGRHPEWGASELLHQPRCRHRLHESPGIGRD